MRIEVSEIVTPEKNILVVQPKRISLNEVDICSPQYIKNEKIYLELSPVIGIKIDPRLHDVVSYIMGNIEYMIIKDIILMINHTYNCVSILSEYKNDNIYYKNIISGLLNGYPKTKQYKELKNRSWLQTTPKNI